MPMSTPHDEKLRGYLIIYVDGYRTISKNTIHIISDGKTAYAIPDAKVLPPNHPVDSWEWWEDGWAVGNNDRGRLCKRFGAFKCKPFHDYDEAVAYMSRRQRRFKQQRHTLVYVTKSIQDTEKLFVVRSMDEIDAIEKKIAGEVVEFQKEEAANQARRALRLPHLVQLQERFGRSVGLALSELLGDIRANGLETVKAERPRSTFARQVAKLRESGLME